MLDEDDDVDKPNLIPLMPFAVTFVVVLPLLLLLLPPPPPPPLLLLPVLLYVDDETDLQTFSQYEYCEHPFSFVWARGQGLPSLSPGYAIPRSAYAKHDRKHTHAQSHMYR